MMQHPYDKPSTVEPIDGDVCVRGPGTVGVSMTPDAARTTAERLKDAAARADDGHVAHIDLEDIDALNRWAERLDVSVETLRKAVIVVGSNSEAVALHLRLARDVEG